MVHHYGGQVYLDGANMNAQVTFSCSSVLLFTVDVGGRMKWWRSDFNVKRSVCIVRDGTLF